MPLADEVPVTVWPRVFDTAGPSPVFCCLMVSDFLQHSLEIGILSARVRSLLSQQSFAVGDEPTCKPVRAIGDGQTIPRPNLAGIGSHASFCHDLKGASPSANQVVHDGHYV